MIMSEYKTITCQIAEIAEIAEGGTRWLNIWVGDWCAFGEAISAEDARKMAHTLLAAVGEEAAQ